MKALPIISTLYCNKVIYVYLFNIIVAMSSGRRERVVISCVTFETVKVAEPVKFYDATKVHLIHYIRDPDSDQGKTYAEFYDRVCEIINENATTPVEIIDYKENVNDFTAMLKTILQIIENENRNEEPADIFVNISAGTSEYAAAAAIASMMMPGTIPFSVRTEEYQVKNVKNVFYDMNKPIGLTKSVKDPKRLPKYSMPIPDRNLVLGLKILDRMNKSRRPPKGPEMIDALKKHNLWRRDAEEDTSKNEHDAKVKMARSDSVYYYRDYISKWLSEGWVYKDTFKKRYFLTDKGEIILGTFYCEIE